MLKRITKYLTDKITHTINKISKQFHLFIHLLYSYVLKSRFSFSDNEHIILTTTFCIINLLFDHLKFWIIHTFRLNFNNRKLNVMRYMRFRCILRIIIKKNILVRDILPWARDVYLVQISLASSSSLAYKWRKFSLFFSHDKRIRKYT